MNHQKHIITTGNEAAAQIAYKVNEVCVVYPITPASEMSELVEAWSANQQQNIFDSIPATYEMQSEAGVAGAMHGALQTGSLTTTFTASQGLLLMAPNMYKMAGELTPHVIHVATRSIATHALSVFGDHSDIMAVRNTGYAFLGAASVQEAMDFSLIAQAASLQSRIPFVHFFDGFRTSHETAKIEVVPDEVIKVMMNSEWIQAHRSRALNPESPVIRGTSQGADVFFQSREAINPFYNACPSIVQNTMDRFYELTGRQYKLFDYIGHPEAEQVIIAMASATETIEQTVQHLIKNGEKVGLLKVRLFRPFSTKHLINALPNTCKSIAVLDRTKEPGATGEPLYLDVVQSVMETIHTNNFNVLPKVVGGRYGLSSKEFTPGMVHAIVENLKNDRPKNNFTIGITDDVTHSSLDVVHNLQLLDQNYQAIFYERKTKDTKSRFDGLTQLIGNAPNTFIQGYTECDYKKSGGTSISHLRIASENIKAPYLIANADFIACDHDSFLEQDAILNNIKTNGTLLVKTAVSATDFWRDITAKQQTTLNAKKISLFVIKEQDIKDDITISEHVVSGLQACFLTFQPNEIETASLSEIQQHITKVDTTISYTKDTIDLVTDDYFAETLLGKLLAGKGEELPVSAMPVDGTYESNTSQFNASRGALALPQWNSDLCTQCGACSMACPQGAIRIKAYDDSYLSQAPDSFRAVKSIETDWEVDLLNYTVQVNPDQCTSCNNCVDACPAKALQLVDKSTVLDTESKNWTYFESIPELDRSKIDTGKVSQQQLQEPLFKYPMAIDGCGEAPYLKLLSQLFGDRMLVANATGASSIFGGALPTTPWSKNNEGRGPAWSNSLFEDNAEFGLGYRLSLDQQEQQAKELLKKLTGQVDFNLIHEIVNATQNSESAINEQRNRVEALKSILETQSCSEANQLLMIVDSLVKKSVWIVGGDGWAYDIGYGGLDHVIASGKNVNILVLDNEVYDNTGGQMSKATPFGASAKFATNGKQKQKKDLGLMAMSYEDVYVASVAIGADQDQTLKAFVEAENYDGPSIIIAYCHSDSHGIDMKNPSQYHKAAVDSGQWLLYRNDPRRMEKGLITLQMDSGFPSLPIEEYLRLEKRFAKLFQKNKEEQRPFIAELQKQIDKRFETYLSRASLDIGTSLKY